MSAIDNARAALATFDGFQQQTNGKYTSTMELETATALRDLIAEHELLTARPSFAEAEQLLHEWLSHERELPTFDRGLHLLAYLKGGGSIEGYGLPTDHATRGSGG